MARAPLRPVPRRPEGPVDPSEAIGHVAKLLPALDEPAHAALGLVEIAGSSRVEVATRRRLSGDEVGDALARGRKALRRSLFPLPGSGWCERAERMISDRMDGELEPPGPARLEVHLNNCPRCVEHELRLAQAIDALVVGFLEAHPAQEPAPARVSVPRAVIKPARPELRVLPFGAPMAPAARTPQAEAPAVETPAVETPAVETPVVETPVVETPAVEAPPVEAPPVEEPPIELPPTEEPPAEEPPAEEPPAEEPPGEEPPAVESGALASGAVAAAAGPAPRPERRRAGTTLAWNVLLAVAVLLAALTVVVTALGVAGVELL